MKRTKSNKKMPACQSCGCISEGIRINDQAIFNAAKLNKNDHNDCFVLFLFKGTICLELTNEEIYKRETSCPCKYKSKPPTWSSKLPQVWWIYVNYVFKAMSWHVTIYRAVMNWIKNKKELYNPNHFNTLYKYIRASSLWNIL